MGVVLGNSCVDRSGGRVLALKWIKVILKFGAMTACCVA